MTVWLCGAILRLHALGDGVPVDPLLGGLPHPLLGGLPLAQPLLGHLGGLPHPLPTSCNRDAAYN